MPFEIYKNDSGKFGFRLKATNGQIVLASETYVDKSGAENGIQSVINNAKESSFDKETAKDGSPYFNMKAGNGQIIGKSEMYNSEAARDNGIASVITNALAGDEVKDLTE